MDNIPPPKRRLEFSPIRHEDDENENLQQSFDLGLNISPSSQTFVSATTRENIDELNVQETNDESKETSQPSRFTTAQYQNQSKLHGIAMHVGYCVFLLRGDQIGERWPELFKQIKRLNRLTEFRSIDTMVSSKHSKHMIPESRLTLRVVDENILRLEHEETHISTSKCPIKGLNQPLKFIACHNKHDSTTVNLELSDHSNISHDKNYLKLFHVQIINGDPQSFALIVEIISRDVQDSINYALKNVKDENAFSILEYLHCFKLESQTLLQICIPMAIRHMISKNLVDQWLPILWTISNCVNTEKATKKKWLDSANDILLKYKQLGVRIERFREWLRLPDLVHIQNCGDFTKIVHSLTTKIKKVEVWRELADTIEKWLEINPQSRKGNRKHLRRSHDRERARIVLDLHDEYATWKNIYEKFDWEILWQYSSLSKHKTLFSFGEYDFQAYVVSNSDTSSPSNARRNKYSIYWRIQSRECTEQDRSIPNDPSSHVSTDSSSASVTEEPLSVSNRKRARDTSSDGNELVPINDAKLRSFYIRAYVQIRFKKKGEEDIKTKFIQCHDADNKWKLLLTEELSDHDHIIQLSGKFFIWGHALCCFYHFALVSSICYDPAKDKNLKHADLIKYSEEGITELELEAVNFIHIPSAVCRMEKLPFHMLILLLKSDRLRVPGGETTLFSVLNHLIFKQDIEGNNNVDTSSISPVYSQDNIDDIYQCVRWAYVQMDSIITALKFARNHAHIYEPDRMYDLICRCLLPDMPQIPRQVGYGSREKPHEFQIITTLGEFRTLAGDIGFTSSQEESQSQENYHYATTA